MYKVGTTDTRPPDDYTVNMINLGFSSLKFRYVCISFVGQINSKLFDTCMYKIRVCRIWGRSRGGGGVLGVRKILLGGTLQIKKTAENNVSHVHANATHLSTVNVDIFTCINFLRFDKMGNFTKIFIRILSVLCSLGCDKCNF